MQTSFSHLLPKSPIQIRISTFFIALLIVVLPCFSQETSKATLSISKEYPTVSGNVKMYYDFSDYVIMCKISTGKVSVQRYDKVSQTVSEKVSLPRDLIWIEGFRRDNLLYCFYSKWGKNKFVRATKEVYLDIIDLEAGDFMEQQKLLFETQLNAASLGLDIDTRIEQAFDVSISDNKNYLIFNYTSIYTGPSKQNQSISNVFSFDEKAIINEITLEHTLNEPLICTEAKAGANGEVLYLGRSLKNNYRTLGIISGDNTKIQNISLSESFDHIDTLQFYQNKFNSNILIGGTYNQDGNHSKPGAFVIEIDYNGKIVREVSYLIDNSGLEDEKNSSLQQVLNISPEKDNSFHFTILNFRTKEIARDIVSSNGVILKSQKSQIKPVSNESTVLSQPTYPHKYMQRKVKTTVKVIESDNFQNIFYFSINPETKKNNLYLNQYSKSENIVKDFLIFENEKALGIDVKQVPLSHIIPVNEDIYYLEVSLGLKINTLLTINLK